MSVAPATFRAVEPMGGMKMMAMPTTSVLQRTSFGFKAKMFYPLTGLLSTGKSLGTVGSIFQLFLFLDQFYVEIKEAREGGLEEDWDWQQSGYLEWMEEYLNEYGLDGRACGLRFICELEHHPIDRFALLGELLAITFDVQNSTSYDVLNQYASARNFGKSLPDGENCGNMFGCPVSIFKLFGGSLNRNF